MDKKQMQDILDSVNACHYGVTEARYQKALDQIREALDSNFQPYEKFEIIVDINNYVLMDRMSGSRVNQIQHHRVEHLTDSEITDLARLIRDGHLTGNADEWEKATREEFAEDLENQRMQPKTI